MSRTRPILSFIASTLILAGFGGACGPAPEKAQRAGGNGGAGAGTGPGSATEAPAATPNGSSSGSGSGSSAGSGSKSGSGSAKEEPPEPEVGVAAYLHTRAEIVEILADPITPFVKNTAPAPEVPRAPAFANMEKFFRRFLDELAKIDRFKELSNVAVAVKETEDLNAFADAWRRITITKPAVTSGAGKSLASTICHEMGHIMRNHPSTYANETFPENLVDALNDYWQGTFDDVVGKYRHDKAKYKAFRTSMEATRKKISNGVKKHESEADVVGAWLCMQIGFTFEEVYEDFEYYEKLDAQSDGAAKVAANDPINWDDGEYEVADPGIFLYQVLWPMDSHPTSAERSKQLLRVKSVLLPKDGEVDDKPAQLWRAEYFKLRDATGVGLSLDAPAPRRVIGRSADGVPVYAPDQGCR